MQALRISPESSNSFAAPDCMMRPVHALPYFVLAGSPGNALLAGVATFFPVDFCTCSTRLVKPEGPAVRCEPAETVCGELFAGSALIVLVAGSGL